ncbi:hypothetical protein WE348_21560 (plasmid) [Alteromonas macleodii]|uniref:hypothetical protein n=1 Tax=Alteromonas macleodii TaxID=28108 RepID=UPI0030CBAC9E
MYSTPSALTKLRSKLRTREGANTFFATSLNLALGTMAYGLVTENVDILMNGAYSGIAVGVLIALENHLPNVALKIKETYLADTLFEERKALVTDMEKAGSNILSIGTKAFDLGVIDASILRRFIKIDAMPEGRLKQQNIMVEKLLMNERVMEMSLDDHYTPTM